MFAFYGSIGIAVVANVFYHVAMKQTSERLDPLVSLLLTYLVAATTCLVAIPFFGRLSLRENIAYLGWPTVLLGISICLSRARLSARLPGGMEFEHRRLGVQRCRGTLIDPPWPLLFQRASHDCEWSRNSACDDGPVADRTAGRHGTSFLPGVICIYPRAAGRVMHACMELHPPVGSARPISVFRADDHVLAPGPLVHDRRIGHRAADVGFPQRLASRQISATASPEFDVNSNRPAVVRMPAAFP